MIYLISNEIELFKNEEYEICTLDFCKEYISKLDVIEVDTETRGFDPYTDDLVCFQLGNSENQFVIPFSTYYLNQFKDILEDKNKLFLFANAKFDLKFFIHNKVNIKNIYDVFLAECVIYTGFNFNNENTDHYIETSLEALCLKYCSKELNKTIRNKIYTEGLTPRVIKYAAEDVMFLSLIREKQMELLTSKELLEVIDLENKAVIAFAHLEYNGIKVDKLKWIELSKEIKVLEKAQVDKLDTILTLEPVKFKNFLPKYKQENLFNFEERNLKINWSSNKQKLEILQVENPKLTSVGDRELQKIKKKSKLAKELIEYNKFSKLKTSFGEKFLHHINPVTNRVHCNIWQILQTGRISVSEPKQNWVLYW